MVDDKFRSYRNRDSVAREGSEQTSCEGLLAELARLTGQGDPYADGGRDGASSEILPRAARSTRPLCRTTAAVSFFRHSRRLACHQRTLRNLAVLHFAACVSDRIDTGGVSMLI